MSENAQFEASPSRLELDGEYDLARKEELASLFAALDPNGAVEVDLSRVTYLDSMVLNELAILATRCQGGSNAVTLTGPNQYIRRILRITRFDELFRVVDPLS